MKILILSFYFEPDLCAGSFRNTAFVQSLSGKLAAEDEIEVITTAPNRYHNYLASAAQIESQGNVSVHRIPLPTHKSGIRDQARAFLSYAHGVSKATRNQSYDLVYASSSRLMTALLGALVSRRTGSLLYLDIRDIFTEIISDLYPQSPIRLLLPPLRFLERFTIRQADRVNLVSPAFVEYFTKIDSAKSYRVFTNGIDPIHVEAGVDIQPPKTEYNEIVYAGNIGKGQGLERIIPCVARRLDPSWRIRIIGDGGMCSVLAESVSGMDNVILEPPVARSQLMERYSAATVLLLHLNDHRALKKVLPSKLFEYAASGKPILAGVDGQAAEFLKENVENSAVFSPCDVDGFLGALGDLRIELTERRAFIERYRRSRINDEMVADMLDLIPVNQG